MSKVSVDVDNHLLLSDVDWITTLLLLWLYFSFVFQGLKYCRRTGIIIFLCLRRHKKKKSASGGKWFSWLRRDFHRLISDLTPFTNSRYNQIFFCGYKFTNRRLPPIHLQKRRKKYQLIPKRFWSDEKTIYSSEWCIDRIAPFFPLKNCIKENYWAVKNNDAWKTECFKMITTEFSPIKFVKKIQIKFNK